MRSFLVFLLVAGFYSPLVSAEYTYQQLIAKDYKEMRKIINKYRQNSPEEDSTTPPLDKVESLRKALLILLMRPDRDGISQSLIGPLREDIEEHTPFPEFLNETVQSSISIFKDKSNFVKKRASHLFILQNALTYGKSLNSDIVLKTLSKTKFKIPKDVTNELRFNAGIGEQASPFVLARSLYKKRKKKERIEKKKKKERIEKKKKKERIEKKKKKERIEKRKKNSGIKSKQEEDKK